MKRLFIIIVLLFVFTGTAYAVVNINTATQSQLETLQVIGSAKAKAIIEHRKKEGLFKSEADLGKVSGVGSSTIKQLHGNITVGTKP